MVSLKFFITSDFENPTMEIAFGWLRLSQRKIVRRVLLNESYYDSFADVEIKLSRSGDHVYLMDMGAIRIRAGDEDWFNMAGGSYYIGDMAPRASTYIDISIIVPDYLSNEYRGHYNIPIVLKYM